jgi:hypothetical protein
MAGHAGFISQITFTKPVSSVSCLHPCGAVTGQGGHVFTPLASILHSKTEPSEHWTLSGNPPMQSAAQLFAFSPPLHIALPQHVGSAKHPLSCTSPGTG